MTYDTLHIMGYCIKISCYGIFKASSPRNTQASTFTAVTLRIQLTQHLLQEHFAIRYFSALHIQPNIGIAHVDKISTKRIYVTVEISLYSVKQFSVEYPQ